MSEIVSGETILIITSSGVARRTRTLKRLIACCVYKFEMREFFNWINMHLGHVTRNSDLLHWIIVGRSYGVTGVINIKILTVCKINQNVSKSFIHFWYFLPMYVAITVYDMSRQRVAVTELGGACSMAVVWIRLHVGTWLHVGTHKCLCPLDLLFNI